MKDHLVRVPTRRWVVCSLLFGAVMFLCLLSLNYKRIGKTPPLMLFLFTFVALLAEWKTIYIGLNEIHIRYTLALFKRRIAINRVSSVEIVLRNEKCYLLFAIDNCLSYVDDKTKKVETYIIKHPIKVIAIQCTKEDALACKQYFDTTPIRTNIIVKNTYFGER